MIFLCSGGLLYTRGKGEISHKAQGSSAGKVLLNFSLAAVNGSSGVLVMVGDLNATEKKHSVFRTSISVLIDT